MNPSDKPVTMPLRDFLIKQIAKDRNIHYSVVEAIITHQFDTANQATYTHKSLEISGFGKFVFSDSKANSQLIRYEDMISKINILMSNPDVTEKELLVHQKKLDGTKNLRDELKKRMS